MDKSQLKERFKDFINRVEGLQELFGNSKKKTLQRFEFEYSFDEQWETHEPLFCLWWSYNGGHVNYELRTKANESGFCWYTKALQDIAYSMDF